MKTNGTVFRIGMSLLMACSLMLSCTEEKPEPVRPPAEVKLDRPEDLDLQLGKGEATKEIAFQSNVPWHVEVSDAGKDWMAVSPSSGGSGAGKIAVTVKENDTYESRSAEILLIAEEETAVSTKAPVQKGSVVIKVHQDQKDVLHVEDKTVELSREAQSFKVKVGHNVAYEVRIQGEGNWLTRVTPSKAYEEEKVEFRALENKALPRECTIVFAKRDSVVGEKPHMILVKQAGIEEKLDLKCILGEAPTGTLEKDEDGTPHFHFNCVKQQFDVEVTANNRYRLEITKDQLAPENLPPYADQENYRWFEWVPASEEEMKKEVSLQKFFMDYNGGNGESYEAVERHVTLKFVSEFGTVEKLVRVTQTPATRIEVPVEFTFEARSGKVEIPFRNDADKPEDFEIEIPADVDWVRWICPQAKTKAEMVEVTAVLELDENDTQRDREAVLVLRVGDGDPVRFRIFQKCLPFLKLDVSSAKKSFPAKGGELVFKVTGNVEYSIDLGKTDWIVPMEEKETPAEEKKGVVQTRTWKYQVLENKTADKRKAKIQVVHPDFGTSFEIEQLMDFAPDQAMQLPGVSPYRVEVPWEGGEIRVPVRYCVPINCTVFENWVKMTANPTDPDFKPAAQAVAEPTMEEGELVFQVQKNENGFERECRIDLYHDGTYTWNSSVPHWEIRVRQARWEDPTVAQLKNAMQKFYDDLDGPNWSRQNGWKEASGDWREYDHVTYRVVNGKIDDFRINISSSTGLKGKIDIEHFPDVTWIELWGEISSVRLVDAPNLEHLVINTSDPNLKMDLFDIRNCPNLTNIVVNGKLLEGKFNVKECPSVSRIMLSNTLIESMDFTQWPGLVDVSIQKSMEFASMDIHGLNELVSFGCTESKVTSIDCSNLPKLKRVYAGSNELLSSLKVTGCPELFGLDIVLTPSLRTIDLSENPKLYSVGLRGAGLEVLDLSHSSIGDIKSTWTPSTIEMPNLRKLDLHGTPIRVIDLAVGDDQHPMSVDIDVRDCKNLSQMTLEADVIGLNAAGCSNLENLNLMGYYNRKDRYVGSLNVEGCLKLTHIGLNAIGNPTFEAFTLTPANVPALESASLSGLVAGHLKLNEFKNLQQISMEDCQMDSVDCSGMSLLREFSLDVTEGKQSRAYVADFTACQELFQLYLKNARLHTLRMEGCPILDRINVSGNRLKDMGPAKLPELQSLYCENNGLEVLDLTLYPKLSTIYCKGNHLNKEFTKDFWQRIRPYGKSYDVKYRYYQEYDKTQEKMVDKTEVRDYGWWFPGEPASRSNGAPTGW